jgi:hypothetical protein
MRGRKATLTNDFHHTEISIIVPDTGWLTAWQCRRIRKALCGMSDCECGDALGMRGRQEWVVVDEDTRPNPIRPIRIARRED